MQKGLMQKAALFSPHPTPYTPHPTPYTPHPTPHTLPPPKNFLPQTLLNASADLLQS